MRISRFIIYFCIVLVLVSPALISCAQEKPAPIPAPAPAPTPAPTPKPAPAPTKVYNWKLFDSYTTKDYLHRQMSLIIDTIENETNGSLKIELFAKGEHPFETGDMLKAVQNRDAEVVVAHSPYLVGVEPILALYSLPMFWPSTRLDDIDTIYSATRDDVVQPILDTWNAELLTYAVWPPVNLHAKVPVTSFDSLKGQRIRGMSPEDVELANVMGGIGVAVAWSECPTAMATGVIDGILTSSGPMYDTGMFEYVKFSTLFESSMNITNYLVNRDALAGLDAATRNAFLKVWEDFGPTLSEGNLSDSAKKVAWAAIDYGVTIVAPTSQFRKEVSEEAAVKIWQPWAQKTGALDTLDSVKQIMAAFAK
ncbi:TRAP transporter substrate-binding protein DctP [Chloroflexota bacterium]